jgi:hypothetical protein
MAATFRWSRDGREIYYLGPGGQLMSVEANSDGVLRLGVPRLLFHAPTADKPFEVTPGGKEFIMLANDH